MDCELNQEVFGEIRGEFLRLGLLGRVFKLKLDGKMFSVRCDDRVFTVYRINSGAHIPPGLPGYAVCRLAPDECFALDRAEDLDSGCLDQDHLDQARVWARLALEEIRSGG